MNTSVQKVLKKEYKFYYNIEFLFELNKQNNFQKKSDFFRENNISRTSLARWKQGSIPARTTLNRIVDYFNRWLQLELTPEALLHEDIQKIIDLNKTKRALSAGLGPIENELLNRFRRLKKEDQKLIMQIIQRLNGA